MPRLNCDDSLNIMTEVKVNFTTDFQTEHSRKEVQVLKEILKELKEERKKNTNERDISNTVDTHFH